MKDGHKITVSNYLKKLNAWAKEHQALLSFTIGVATLCVSIATLFI